VPCHVFVLEKNLLCKIERFATHQQYRSNAQVRCNLLLPCEVVHGLDCTHRDYRTASRRRLAPVSLHGLCRLMRFACGLSHRIRMQSECEYPPPNSATWNHSVLLLSIDDASEHLTAACCATAAETQRDRWSDRERDIAREKETERKRERERERERERQMLRERLRERLKERLRERWRETERES